MADDKTQFVSPAGRAHYPWLNPGNPDTKFDNDGLYRVSLEIPGPDFQPLKALIDEMAEAWLEHLIENDAAEAGDDIHVPYEEQEDGSFMLKVKTKAQGTNKDGEEWERSPARFDARGEPVPDHVEIGGGSLLKVAGVLKEYKGSGNIDHGITAYLNAVQILELEQWEPDAESYGFEEQDDGYSTAEYTNDEPPEADESEEEAEPDSDDFDF